MCHDRVGGEGGFLENTIRMNLPKGLPVGFGEICVDFWDFERGVPEPPFLLLLAAISIAGRTRSILGSLLAEKAKKASLSSS